MGDDERGEGLGVPWNTGVAVGEVEGVCLSLESAGLLPDAVERWEGILPGFDAAPGTTVRPPIGLEICGAPPWGAARPAKASIALESTPGWPGSVEDPRSEAEGAPSSC